MLDTGNADLPAVLCLHSLFFDPRMFEELAAATDGQFRLVAPELAGQGTRAKAGEPAITMEEVVADLWKTLDNLGLQKFSIVAQSMGGDIAVRMAAAQPGRIHKMVLLGTSVCAEPAGQREQLDALVDDLENHGFTTEKVDMLMSIMFGQSTQANPDKAETLSLWRGRMNELGPELGPAMRGVVHRASATDMLNAVQAPTLVVSGTEDLVRPQAWSDEIFEGIPDAQLWRLKAVGHSPLQEQPDLIIPRVVEFLSRPARPARATLRAMPASDHTTARAARRPQDATVSGA